MIQILLLILKIFGITILAVFFLILLILALVLFIPVFYRVRIIHNPEQTKVTAKISFLWPVITAMVQYFNKISYKVRTFGIPILDSEKPKKEKEPKVKKPKRKKETINKQKKDKLTASKGEQRKETVAATAEKADSFPEEKREILNQTKKEQKTGIIAKIRAKIQKIRETISKVVAKIKKLAHQKEEVFRILDKPETKSAMKFTWGKLGKLLKHICPRKVKGYIAYGADNPATTGQVLGILSVIYARTGHVLEIRPNFTEKQLETDVLIKGRIQLFTLLLIGIKVALNKELRQVIKEFKGIKDIE